MVEATSIENTLFPVPLLKVLVLGWFELSPGQYRCLGPGLGEVLVLATGEETSPSPGPGQSWSWLLKQTQSWSWFGHLFGPVEVLVLKYWVPTMYAENVVLSCMLYFILCTVHCAYKTVSLFLFTPVIYQSVQEKKPGV